MSAVLLCLFSTVMSAGGKPIELVPPGSTWRYLDNGSDLGGAWRDPDFDDSGWSLGSGDLGFGDSQATTLSSGATTYYFRHRFQASAEQIDSARGGDGFYRLIFDLLRDDGAVVYLNGIELVRSNMEPGVAINHQTFAVDSVRGADEATYMPASADSATALRAGENVLAVEVHQATADSSDISFDLALSAVSRGAFWQAGPDMIEPRLAHTAVRLSDGRVLVAGGRSDTHLDTAEIFDPTTNTWAATGSMNVARSDHQSILLADGRVLVFSGRVGGIDITSAEIYDPQTEAWSVVDSLRSGRFAPIVVGLNDGRVLVAGGYNQGGVDDFLHSCELFDPETELWSVTGNYVTGTNKQIGFVLGDGSVLSAGGYDGGGSRHRNAELYDPATGRWSNTGFMSENRYRFAGALLEDGRVLAIAGGNDGTSNNRSSEIYNPATGSWTGAGNLAFRRRDHLSAMLPAGRVIIAGGGIGASEVFNTVTETWSPGGALAVVRSGFTMTSLLDGRVLATGGRVDGETQTSTEIYGERSNPSFEEDPAVLAELVDSGWQPGSPYSRLDEARGVFVKDGIA